MLKKLHSHLLYKVGIFLSTLCLVHCLAMPFVLTLLPFLAKDIISHQVEVIIVLISLSLAIYIMVRDYRIHHNTQPLVWLTFAVLIQLAAIFQTSETWEPIILSIGALFLALAYLKNWKTHAKTCPNHKL